MEQALISIPVLHRNRCGVIAVYPDRVEWPGTRIHTHSLRAVRVRPNLATATLVLVATDRRVEFILAHRDAARLRERLAALIPTGPPADTGAGGQRGQGRAGRLWWRCTRAG